VQNVLADQAQYDREEIDDMILKMHNRRLGGERPRTLLNSHRNLTVGRNHIRAD
jgi:hypothetical protein